MKKVLSVLLSFALLSLLTAVSAFAATSSASGIEKPRRVRISASQRWVRVDRTIELTAVITPDTYNYDKVEWYTLDYDIASVDEYGSVTGIKPGTAHIEAFVYVDGPTRRIEVGSAEIEIEVRGTVVSGYSYSSAPSPSNTTVSRKGTIPTKTINEAVKKAMVAGTTKDATFENYTSVSTVSLESAAAEMQLGGGAVLLNFDTLSSNGKTVEGRLTINPRAYKRATYDDPLQVGHSINVLMNTNDSAVKKVRDTFQKFYKNEMLVIKAGQKDGYGMNVTCTVKTGNTFSKAKQSDLRLYSYDPDKGINGTYRLIKNPNFSIDGSKSLTFTTDTGNYLIISNGALAKK